jgi:hypothetical protein
MRQPRIPPLLTDIIQSGLSSFDGVVFDSREACPACGSKLSGYDTKKKQFAVLMDDEGQHPVHVLVKRFMCTQCRALCFADEPFYPDTRSGSPVVDLCVTLASTLPFSRTATYLANMGIVIDRGSVRNYARGGFLTIPTADVFGVRLPLSIVSLSTIAARTGEGGRIEGAEALAACGFPSAHRAAFQRQIPRKEGEKRDDEKDKEEWQTKHP